MLCVYIKKIYVILCILALNIIYLKWSKNSKSDEIST